MKNIPNILTFSRVILAILLLLFFDRISPLFIFIFVIAMLTDLIDGILARKMNVCSNLGAFLDSIADFLLDMSLIKIVYTMNVMTFELTVWMLVALGIGAISPIINFIKHKTVFFIHSVPCKLCMWMLLGIPFAIQLGFINVYIVATLSIITFSMIELVIMSILLIEPDPNARSVYSVIKQNQALKI